MRRLVLLVFLCTACGVAESGPSDAGADAGTPPETFIALDRDFAGYEAWAHFGLDGPAADDAHASDHRDVWVNRLPPHGSSRFPVGTLIVKELSNGQILAMAKRGGDYNAQGAVGWEWFELAKFRGAPYVVWRGIVPASGEGYAGIAGGTCNGCHGGAAANDYVRAGPLQLSNF